MDIWRKRLGSRSVYDANDLFLESDIKECVAWFLPKWAYYVARSFLFDYGQRMTSFSLDYSSGLYLIPDSTQKNEIDLVISEALGGDIVCVQDIVNALQGVSAAIMFDCETGGCEDVGSGGAGQKEAVPTPNIDNGVDDPTGGGYQDYSEYKDNKCGWANKIVDDILADMVKVGASTTLTWVASLLTLAFVTPIPFDDIFAIVGIGLSFVIGGIILAFSQVIITEISDNRDAFVCTLYEAESATEAREDFLAESTLSVLHNTFLGSWLRFDSLNRLFTKQAVVDAVAPCGCGGCDITILAGQLVSVVGDTYTITSTAGPPTIPFWAAFSLDAPCELVQEFEMVSISPSYLDIVAPMTSKSGYIDENDVEIEEDWSEFHPPLCVKRVNFFSQTGPFTAVFTLKVGIC